MNYLNNDYVANDGYDSEDDYEKPAIQGCRMAVGPMTRIQK